MTGTIFSLPLTQRVDINGKPLSGALLSLYAANTSLPVNSYQDFGLTLLNPNPLVCDASGMIPPFWLADGAYRARLTTAGGIDIFDFDNLQALGPSTGTGGGSGATVDPTTIFQTGWPIWLPITGALTGFVRMNARNIGSASSGANERANADVQPLFIWFWTNFPNTLCPVSGGRGGTALADFTANKTIATLDMRDCGIFGLDDMGNSALGGITSGTPTVPGSFIGAEKVSITVAQANLPNVNFAVNITDPGHTHTVNNAATVGSNVSPTGGSGKQYAGTGAVSTETATTGITAVAPSGGSGTAITPTTISPGRFGTWYIHL